MVTIFLSYSWANTVEADEIDRSLVKKGYFVKRDVRDIGYLESIRAFMKTIDENDFVLSLVSDNFLRSENCMYEMSEVLSDVDFQKRIIPIVLDSAKIYTLMDRANYILYWSERCKDIEKIIQNPDLPDNAREGYKEDLRRYRKIQKKIYDFMTFLADSRGEKMAKLKAENYKTISEYICKVYKSKRQISENLAELRRLNTFRKGQKSWGIIKLIYNYGFFIQISSRYGFRDGLLHKKKLEKFGYNFSSLRKIFEVGDSVYVEISEINFKTPAAYLTGGLGFSPTEEFKVKIGEKVRKYLQDAQDAKVEILDLRGLGLEQLPKEIANIKSLKQLFLGENNFQDMPKELDLLPNLETVFCDFKPKRKLPFEFVFYGTGKQNQDFL